MEFSNVKYEATDSIGILTIDRPKVLNALNSTTVSEIRSVLAAVKEDKAVRVLIITGGGDKAFIAGADIHELQRLKLGSGFAHSQLGQLMNHEIETLGIPTIAAVNGLALGGGCELAISCTLRVVSRNAKFGLPELGLGILPGFGGTQRLARLIGKGRALWYLLTGDMIDAEKAVEMGLASQMLRPEELIEKTIWFAKKIAEKAPLAVTMALYAVKYGTDVELETALVLESAMANLTIASEDKNEGIAAFFEKRKPDFKGK